MSQTMKQFDYLFFITKASPPHKAHLEIITTALEMSKHVIVGIGSSFRPRTVELPWTFPEREQMIRTELYNILSPNKHDDIINRLHVVGLRDYMYSNPNWIKECTKIVDKIVASTSRYDPYYTNWYSKTHKSSNNDAPVIGIVGHHKDETSFYLDMFPQWKKVEFPLIEDIHATNVRTMLFEDQKIHLALTKRISSFIKKWMQTNEYKQIQAEYDVIKNYKKQFESLMYEPTFNTADAVVIQSGHVLLVRRKAYPGKGLIALPGGFVNPNETLQQAALRELKEETKIKIPNKILEKNIVNDHVFDAPKRSSRGRTITQAFHINLGDSGDLPKVKGGDDADKAFWMPITAIYDHSDMMFEDHLDIIDFFV